jgi:hypothetical protein
MGDVGRNPICPLCEQVVLPGDHVVFGHGELVHLNCHFLAGGVVESVAAFLVRNGGLEYCHGCVARSLNVGHDQVVKAVTMLRTTDRYRVTTIGTCSVCGHRWTTIRAERAFPGSGGLPAS